MSRAPATECLPAHARVCYARRRPNLDGSLTGAREPWAVTAGVPGTSMPVGGGSTGFVCTGRWFKLECKLRFASVRSSDELVVRVSPPDSDSCQIVLSQGLLMVRRQSSRFAARVTCAPLRCVHAWGVAHARHSPVSLRIGPSPLRRIVHSLRFPQSSEMRVAQPNLRFSTVENRVTYTPVNMHPSIGMTGNPSSANRLRRRTIASRYSRRLCAATGTGCGARPHHRFSTVENRSRLHPTSTCVQASV